jgi:hypothetical protein
MGATAFAYPPSERFDFVVDIPFDVTTYPTVFDAAQKLARQPEWSADFYKLWAGNIQHILRFLLK